MAKEGHRITFHSLPEKAKDVERLKILSAEGQHYGSIAGIIRKYKEKNSLENLFTYEDFRSIYLNLRLSGGVNGDLARRLMRDVKYVQSIENGLEQMYWAVKNAEKRDLEEEKWVAKVENWVKTLESGP